MTDAPALAIRDLAKSFGPKVAVAGVSLDVPRGCFFGLVGPNGAGKTTTLRMATGLLRPDYGGVWVNGIDVWRDPVAAKAVIGVLPEDLRLFERLTGAELLTYSGLLRRMKPDEVARRSYELLHVLGLTEAANTLVVDYSHGMRKKIALASAVLHNPSILFLDEPFEAIDPVSARTIRTVLERYTDGGATVVFSSHVMETVERLCDRVAIMSAGRIVADGTLDEVRGGATLEDAFVGLVGAADLGGQELGWLGLFVRLKLRLLRNGFRAGWQRAAGVIVGAVFAIPLAIGGFAILAAARSADADRPAIAVLVFTALFLGWACFPVLGFGSDETLDPTRLALFPLGRRDLMPGLLAASVIGVAPLATMLALTGSLVGYAPAGLGVVVVAAAPLVELALCLTASRAVVTALARMLRSRRGRDVTLILITMVAVLPQILRVWLLPRDNGQSAAVDIRPAVRFLRWTPPGLAGHAMVDAGKGRVLVGAGELALAALVVVPLLLWWARSLERSMTTAEATATSGGGAGAAAKQGKQKSSAATRSSEHGRPLFPRPMAFLPVNRATAVTARELRYLSRDPRRRVQLLSGFLVPLFAFIPLIAGNGLQNERAVLGAVGFAFFLGLTSLNQLGVDGKALWVNVAAGNDPRSDLIGKNLAALFWNVPLLVIATCGLALFTGGWAWAPLALVLSIATLGLQLGVGNVMSVRMPTPQPDSQTNPWAQNSGQGCLAGLAGLLALALEAVMMAPVAVVVLIGLGWTPGLVIAVPLALAEGALVWWLGLRYASRWLWWRLPELLDAVSPQKAV